MGLGNRSQTLSLTIIVIHTLIQVILLHLKSVVSGQTIYNYGLEIYDYFFHNPTQNYLHYLLSVNNESNPSDH